MRVATVCFSKTVGGLELATLRRGAELRDHGHHVVAVLPDAPDLAAHAGRMELPVDHITPTIPYLDLPAARKLSMVIRREEVEVLLVARSRDLSTAMLAAGREVAVVLYQQMQSGIDKHDLFHNKVYRRLDGAIAITGRVRDQLAANTALAPEKISVVPYGIDTARFSPDALSRAEARAQFGLPDDAFVIGIVGGFTPGKGQREFLEAVAMAVEEEPRLERDLYALLVGEREQDRSEYTLALRRLRDELPFSDRVRFHPFVDDPRPVYRALDLFVLASHSETFGMVLQEAVTMGVAAIATDSGGVPEIVEHERTGLLVPPKDPRAIADAMLRLYRDPELRSQLASAGRIYAQEAYDFDRQYPAFEQALERAIALRRP